MLWLALPALAWLVGCGGGAPPVPPTPTATPSPTPTPDPVAIWQKAGERMQALQSVAVAINRSGAPAYLDAEQTLVFNSATGHYAAPDAFQALIKVLGPGIALEMQTIAIGQEQWLTNPLTQQWEKLPPGFGFNPLVLFDPRLGWQAVVHQGTREVTLVGLETFGQSSRYHLVAVIDGARAAALSAGLSQGIDVAADVWVDPATLTIVQLTFETPGPEGVATQWQLTFSDFNQPVTIQPPSSGQG